MYSRKETEGLAQCYRYYSESSLSLPSLEELKQSQKEPEKLVVDYDIYACDRRTWPYMNVSSLPYAREAVLRKVIKEMMENDDHYQIELHDALGNLADIDAFIASVSTLPSSPSSLL